MGGMSLMAMDLSGITSGLTSGITDIGSAVLTSLGAVVPVAMPILGGVMVVTIGIKFFKKISH